METATRFTETEIQLAKELREHGLPWTPMLGQFVLDLDGTVDRESPFQSGVFFVLNFEYFMKIAGGEDRFREIMMWLPTWDDCRKCLRSFGVADAEVLQHLLKNRESFESGQERLLLYRLLLKKLQDSHRKKEHAQQTAP